MTGSKKNSREIRPETGVAGQRRAHHRVVENRSTAHASKNSGGQPHHDGKQHRANGELHGGGKEGEELLNDRLPGDYGFAQITFEHVHDINPVLLKQRLVEPELGAKLRVALRVEPALPDQQLDGIPRDKSDHCEREQRDADKGRNHESHAGEDEAEHA